RYADQRRAVAITVRSMTTVIGGVPALIACLPKTAVNPRTTAERSEAETPWTLAELQREPRCGSFMSIESRFSATDTFGGWNGVEGKNPFHRVSREAVDLTLGRSTHRRTGHRP